jgi:hypothetical protein
MADGVDAGLLKYLRSDIGRYGLIGGQGGKQLSCIRNLRGGVP